MLLPNIHGHFTYSKSTWLSKGIKVILHYNKLFFNFNKLMSNKNVIDLVKTKNTIAWNLQFYDVMWLEVDQIVLVYHWCHCATLILITFIKENDTKWR